jgi:Bacterial toxin 28
MGNDRNRKPPDERDRRRTDGPYGKAQVTGDTVQRRGKPGGSTRTARRDRTRDRETRRTARAADANAAVPVPAEQPARAAGRSPAARELTASAAMDLAHRGASGQPLQREDAGAVNARARADATDGNTAGAPGAGDGTHDPRVPAAHGLFPIVQAKGNPAAQAPPRPRQAVGPDAADAEPPDAITLRPAAVQEAGAEIVQVDAGDVLTVQASAADGVEVVIVSGDGTVVARDTGTSVRLTHAPRTASSAGTFAIHTRAPGATGLLRAAAPSAQLMVAVEPRGGAGDAADDGAVYLSARQHLLLNLFGVTPRALHPGTGLALAEALDALEVVARGAGAGPDAVPTSAGEHQLAIRHTSAGAVEQAVYSLTSANASLILETVFDAGTGALRCRLVYRDVHGAEIHGALQHAVALADGVPVQPAADPVGDYLAADPGLVGALDDFSDLAGGEGERGAEGLGSFLEGAVAGDLAGNDSWSAVGGQTAMGLVPVAGQIADIRDIAAAGADVLGGTDGAWARLGISVVAVVPGLDFLKGGSKAGRKALNEAAGEAKRGTARSGLARAGKVLSREAAARAARELVALAVARRELLARWQSLLMDRALSRETLGALRKARNALQDHLQPADLTGALRDRLGVPVRLSGSGKAWDHLDEVGGVSRSLGRLSEAMGKELRHVPRGSSRFKQLSHEMDAVEETVARIERFLEIR